MKEILKNYWYVVVIILVIFISYFMINISNDEYEIIKEEIVVEEEVKIIDSSNYYIDIKGEVKNPGVYEISRDSRIIDVINIAGGLTKNADTSLLNLSKKVTDEMSIKIYSKTEVKKAKESIKKEPEVIEIIKEIEKECVCPEVEYICDIKNDAVIEEVTKQEESKNEEVKTEVNNDAKEEIKDTSPSLETNGNDNKLVNINTATKEELMTLSGIGESKAENIIEYRSKNKFVKLEDILNVNGIGESVFEKIKEYITL